MATSRIRIGWIGAGAMGQPICRHLLKAGYALDVYDKDPTKISALVSEGASAGISAGELAGKCDLIISMVWNDDGLRDVVLGPTGVLTGARTGISYIDMSTVSPKVSEEIAAQLARHDIPYLRAPVSGSVPVAEAGKLTIYASGPRILFDNYESPDASERLHGLDNAHGGYQSDGRRGPRVTIARFVTIFQDNLTRSPLAAEAS